MNRKQQALFDRVKNGSSFFMIVRTYRRGLLPISTGRGDIAVLKSLCPASQVEYLPPNVKRYPVLRIVSVTTTTEEIYPTGNDPKGSVYQTVTEVYNVKII